ncbi:MAG: hypothetical protein EBS08_07235, partial [Cytophagia bacterium]|nr:hypothetical protein [Cytophagia bacterium]
MNILVCLSQVPDTTTKISFTSDNKELNKAGVQFIINPYDELALTKALELNEASGGGSITVVHVGGADAEPVLRKALAIGADQAVRIDAAPMDARQVAAEIAHYVSSASFDLVLAGRESIDYNGGLVGGMLAEYLDWPLVNVATSRSAGSSVRSDPVRAATAILIAASSDKSSRYDASIRLLIPSASPPNTQNLRSSNSVPSYRMWNNRSLVGVSATSTTK